MAIRVDLSFKRTTEIAAVLREDETRVEFVDEAIQREVVRRKALPGTPVEPTDPRKGQDLP